MGALHANLPQYVLYFSFNLPICSRHETPMHLNNCQKARAMDSNIYSLEFGHKKRPGEDISSEPQGIREITLKE